MAGLDERRDVALVFNGRRSAFMLIRRGCGAA